ncbi:hypothetical protein ORV05_11925 [Amycolatopsis cynarae]|uniref:Uncharacterized protein n=1 Tax=Amycolatopsis cynarae TaxID=2995223 RepID=A0ABY7B7X2_9PSEU|nr:hypothetical protein [Amycolatopsis sp. HUAS 11-8]WAL68440.1 hypothetical protein ORV05_11925 [Amycolatopsis sp. HUAS 11-8]
MGIRHALAMQKLVRDAKSAFARGDSMFEAVLDIDPRARVSMRKIRAEISRMVDAIEPVGWRCVNVEPFLASVEITFIRQ